MKPQPPRIFTETKLGRSPLEEAVTNAQQTVEKKIKTGYAEKGEVDQNTRIKPMLAQKWDWSLNRGKIYSNPRSKTPQLKRLAVQPKLDGVRCLAQHIDRTQPVELWSRGRNPWYNMNHIRDELAALFRRLPRGVITDGEIMHSGLEFNKLDGLARRITLDEEGEQLQRGMTYHIYDLYDADQPDLTFEQRFEILKKVFENLKTPVLHLVQTDIIVSEEDIDRYYEVHLESKYEGMMIRDLASVYKPDGRSDGLLKRKPVESAEFKVIGHTEGIGKDKGTVVFIVETRGGPQPVRPKATHEERARMLKCATEYYGVPYTVEFQQYEPSGLLRFPVGKAFRPTMA